MKRPGVISLADAIKRPLRRVYEYFFKGRGNRSGTESMEGSSTKDLPGYLRPVLVPVKIVSEWVLIEAGVTEPESPKKENPVEESLESESETGEQGPKTSTRSEPSGNHERWKVTYHPKSPFEKIGRLYLSGENLVIRSELDRRVFSMRLSDVDEVLEGEVGVVYSLDGENQIGTAKVSVSGKGMNLTIKPFHYTTPLQSLTRMLDGKQRKAPLFVGREQVEGNI